jgi:hypothetical protein
MKRRNSICFCSVTLLLIVFFVFNRPAEAQVNIPVVNGPHPTCLGQLYSDILWPTYFVGNGYYNPDGPTAFVNSTEGVLGLTIFFEVHPYGYEAVYDSSGYGAGGSEAMAGVAATAINRSNTNNIDLTNAPGDPWIILATKDMSPSIWNVNSLGTGGLKMYSTLISVLSGATHTQNCDGLMYSFAMAIAAINAHANGTLALPLTANPTNNFPKTLFFNTDGSTPSVLSSRKPFLQRLGLANAPRYPSGAYPWYFWTITDATAYPGKSVPWLY